MDGLVNLRQLAAAGTTAAVPPTPGRGGSRVWMALRVAAAGAACLVAGAFLYDRFANLGSTRAVLSGTMVTLRAPIEGELDLAHVPLPGDILGGADATFAVIRNIRADTGRLADLRADLGTAGAELRAVQMRLGAAREEAMRAIAAATAFRAARLAQLAARGDEVESGLAAARARLREAEAALRRTAELARAGVGAQAQLDQTQRAHAVAEAEAVALERRRATLQGETRAAGDGVFVSDVGTDRSASQQAADRLRLVVEELQALEVERVARVASLAGRLAEEQRRAAMFAEARVALPSRARLLAMLAARGEQVRPGQDLAYLADCSRPVANVEVDERTFRSLAIGMAAEFLSASGNGAAHPGHVAQMASPLRADPAAPAADASRHRVTVALDPEGLADECASGTVGRVRFLPAPMRS